MAEVTHQILINGRFDKCMSEDLAEFEVMESMRGETRFRVRLASNVMDGKIPLLSEAKIAPGKDKTITIVAYVGLKPKVLAHGVILDRQVEIKDGGAGTFIDLIGADKRATMDRNQSDQATHSGTVPLIVTGLLAKHKLIPDVDQTIKSEMYTPVTRTLSQSGSDLQLVRKLAAQNAVEFWIDWKLLPGGKVLETGHFKAVPPRGGAGLVKKLGASILKSCETQFKINAPDKKRTILSFSARRQTNVPNSSGDVHRVDMSSGKLKKSTEKSNDAPLGKKLDNKDFQASVMSAGSIQEAGRRTQAALNDAAWSVAADVETTSVQLGGIVRPRDVVTVTGAGGDDDGEYLVWAVTHMADSAKHHMKIELRRNRDCEGEVWMTDTSQDVLESHKGKFYGKYRGVVSKNIGDIESRGRIFVQVPQVLGTRTVLAEPCVPYAGKDVGFWAIPPEGTVIWVEFEAGDPSYPIWTGCLWKKGDVKKLDAIPQVKFFKTDKFSLRIDEVLGEVKIENKAGCEITMGTTGVKIKGAQVSVQTTAGGEVALKTTVVDVNKGALKVI